MANLHFFAGRHQSIELCIKLQSMADKVKIELEYPVRSSPPMLYNFLSNPSGLAEWFCDDVESRGDRYVFKWGDTEEVAHLVRKRQDTFVQYKWDEDTSPNKFSFEFRIVVDDITLDATLVVTDYVDENDENEMRLLWNSQIHNLLHTIGA